MTAARVFLSMANFALRAFARCVCFFLQGAENWEKLRTAILANSDVVVPEYYLKQFHACEGFHDFTLLLPQK